MNPKQVFAVLFISFLLVPVSRAQADLDYQLPPERLVQFVDALPTPSVSISNDGHWMLIMERPGLPSIEEVSQPELRLGGLRINPRTNGSSRDRYINNLKLVSLDDNREFEVTGLPENPRISTVEWSPDGKKIAFCLTLDNGIELWILDVGSRQASRLTSPFVNDAMRGSPYQWHPNSNSIIYKSIDKSRISPPEPSAVPTGPVVQENIGGKAPVRTYQDLLKNPHDEKVFEYYTNCQLVKVSLTGETADIGPKGIIIDFSISPDGHFLLVETVHRPFSYLVPYYRFPLRIEIWDMKGDPIHTIADLPLADNIPTGFMSVRKGPREVQWRSDVPAYLFWVEALDEGDGNREADFRDQVLSLKAPFSGEVEKGPKCALRYDYINWGNSSTALLYENW